MHQPRFPRLQPRLLPQLLPQPQLRRSPPFAPLELRHLPLAILSGSPRLRQQSLVPPSSPSRESSQPLLLCLRLLSLALQPPPAPLRMSLRQPLLLLQLPLWLHRWWLERPPQLPQPHQQHLLRPGQLSLVPFSPHWQHPSRHP